MKLTGIIGTLVLSLFIGTGAIAQDSTANNDGADKCAEFRSLYFQYLKQKMYQDAANFWNKAWEYCGEEGSDGKFFTNGRYIYSKLLRQDGLTPEHEKGLNDTLYMIYEARMKVENDPEWTADYASELVSNKSEDFDKIDSLFAASLPQLKGNVKSGHVKDYFKHLILNKFNAAPAEEKEDARTVVIEEYIVLSEYVGMALKNAEAAEDENEIKRQKGAQSFLDKYFLKIAQDCSVLEGVFSKKLKSLPTEKEAKKKAVNNYLNLLDQKNCQETEVYGQFVDTLIAVDPTASAYYFGGSYALKNDNAAKAAEYFEKAVELEADGENKDKYLYSLATAQYAKGSYSSAFRTAKQVEGEYKGDALYICANSIAATANSCGSSTFERKANFWLANDYINRAIANGKEGVSSGKYLSSAPTSTEAFNEGVSAGASVSCSCWGESTTARF
jgi:hypothetical protein